MTRPASTTSPSGNPAATLERSLRNWRILSRPFWSTPLHHPATPDHPTTSPALSRCTAIHPPLVSAQPPLPTSAREHFLHTYRALTRPLWLALMRRPTAALARSAASSPAMSRGAVIHFPS